MENFLAFNIKYLRKTKQFTQDGLADKIGVKRAMIGSYEEGRAVPKIPVLRELSHYFNVSIDDLINSDLSNADKNSNFGTESDIRGKRLRVLTSLVDRDNKELITLVPQKATAGYLDGYGDPDYIESLPRFSLPLPELAQERTYRAFQIQGRSMEPVPSGSYIICEYLQNWNEIKDGKCYIIVTQDEGVVYKRLYRSDDNTVVLKSDNSEYTPYSIEMETITEVWKALGYISFTLPEADEMHMGKLTAMMYKMQDELEILKKKKS